MSTDQSGAGEPTNRLLADFTTDPPTIGFDTDMLACGKSRRQEHHLPHEWRLQASDDSPEQVTAWCPGWAVERG